MTDKVAEQSKEEFIAAVVANIMPLMPEGASDHDKETVGWSAGVAWNSGCTVEEAIRYAKTFEEVSPDLAEERAFAIRRVLAAKLMGKHRATAAEVGSNGFIV